MLKQLYKFLKKNIFNMSFEDRKELLDFTAFLQKEKIEE